METIPVLPPSRSRGPTIRVRRYDHNDFEKFDEENVRGSHLRVGSASIGKVDIDCRYHWKKAQWGVLGDPERPAGIVYMDITFKQPQGYWLQRASVFVTLSQDVEGPKSARYRPSAKSLPRRSLGSDYAVQITPQYGPKHLTGTKTLQFETKTNSFTPTIGAGGIELGGVGHQSTTAKDRGGQWEFKGTVTRPKTVHDYCTLEWELTGNELDPGQVHKQEYNTAFAFEHSERPVIMRVEVEGKLQSKSRQLKNRLLKFSTHFGKSNRSTLTHLDLTKTNAMKENLDCIADGLDMAMQLENYKNTPIVVPDPTQAQFYAAQQTNQHWEGNSIFSSSRFDSFEQHRQNGEHVPHQTHKAGVDASQHHELLQEISEQASLEPLRQALRLRQENRNQQAPAFTRPKDTASKREEDSGYDTQAPDKISERKQADKLPLSIAVPPHVPSPTTPAQPEPLEKAIQEIAQVPAILILFNLLAAIARWLAKPQTPRPMISPSGAEKEPHKQNHLGTIDESSSSLRSEASGVSESPAWKGLPPPAPKPPNSNISHEGASDEGFLSRRGVPSEGDRKQMRDRYRSTAYYK